MEVEKCEVVCACGCETAFLLAREVFQRARAALPRLAAVRVHEPEHALWFDAHHNPEDPEADEVTCSYPGACVVSETRLHAGPVGFTLGVVDEGHGPTLVLVGHAYGTVTHEFRGHMTQEAIAALRDMLSLAAVKKDWSATHLNAVHPLHDAAESK